MDSIYQCSTMENLKNNCKHCDFAVIFLTQDDFVGKKDIQTITAQRSNDLAPYGPTVLMSQGIGLTPEAFQEGVANGTVVIVGRPGAVKRAEQCLGAHFVEHLAIECGPFGCLAHALWFESRLRNSRLSA